MRKIASIQESFGIAYSYDVHFERDVFAPGHRLLVRLLRELRHTPKARVLVCIDSGVVAARPGYPARVEKYFRKNSRLTELVCSPLIIPGGEICKKGWTQANRVIEAIVKNRMCRHSFVIVVGGGSVIDVAGFAASLVHRGLKLIRIPSTVLAQDDAGIGVKNGINAYGAKNMLGCFAPPAVVINDLSLLNTLPDSAWCGGIAEAFKVAIIKDRAFFRFLVRHAQDLRRRNSAVMEETVRRCAELHLTHIRDGGDPFESGDARPLDFGHWAAHRLEAMSGYKLGHGQAVAVGIALDSCYAEAKGMIARAELRAILNGLRDAGLPIWHPLLGKRDPRGRLPVIDGLEQFREHLGGVLHVTLPVGIGKKREIDRIDTGLVRKHIEFLKRLSQGRVAL